MSSQQGIVDERLTVRDLIHRVGLEPGPEQECSYIPGRCSRLISFRAAQLPPGMYHSLMDLNFRRSGDVFYRPACDSCHQCTSIRLPVATFEPNRAQRRCWSHNQDLDVTIARSRPTDEKHAMFKRYLQVRHDRQMSDDWESFCDFLYCSPIRTREVMYRLDGTLVGVGILDLEPEAASTVYCYFDPDLTDRSLGTFNILWTIDYCRSKSIPYVYLGYYVGSCRQMSYKINFRPCERLSEEDCWEPAPAA